MTAHWDHTEKSSWLCLLGVKVASQLLCAGSPQESKQTALRVPAPAPLLESAWPPLNPRKLLLLVSNLAPAKCLELLAAVERPSVTSEESSLVTNGAMEAGNTSCSSQPTPPSTQRSAPLTPGYIGSPETSVTKNECGTVTAWLTVKIFGQ